MISNKIGQAVAYAHAMHTHVCPSPIDK